MNHLNVSYVGHVWPVIMRGQYASRTCPSLQFPWGPLNGAYAHFLEPQSIMKVSSHWISSTPCRTKWFIIFPHGIWYVLYVKKCQIFFDHLTHRTKLFQCTIAIMMFLTINRVLPRLNPKALWYRTHKLMFVAKPCRNAKHLHIIVPANVHEPAKDSYVTCQKTYWHT